MRYLDVYLWVAGIIIMLFAIGYAVFELPRQHRIVGGEITTSHTVLPVVRDWNFKHCTPTSKFGECGFPTKDGGTR